MSRPLPYSPDLERPDPNEPELFERIAAVMRAGGELARDGEGPGGRLSHVQTLAAFKGELVVHDLPPELAQGAFARPRTYPVVARLSHLPGEDLDNRGVSSPRGLSIKLFGVDGRPLADHQGGTQDFVLETAPVFNARCPRTFLAAISTVEASAPFPQFVKHGVSAAARAANRVLETVGAPSANLDVIGHPAIHPLSESYYSQAPMRWGDYVAKLGAFPAPAQSDLRFRADEPDALAHAASDRIARHGAEWTLAAQLRTDADAMPIENARTLWPEELSSYRPVATLRFPPQNALAPSRVRDVEALSFSPAHSLEAHRPLGGIMRARLALYTQLGCERRRQAGLPTTEPASPDVIAD
ncbi:catalase family protein [Sphingomonas lenta]|uniref:Catalase n=1 Tax=Sphingomonas lenta TaxID=1141887 RepID=A0A2A2SC22_9SPHN|nr:catalase family protein [Sphingomonas lenta]PAX06551.1 catalase [Sphingomonas lenta]